MTTNLYAIFTPAVLALIVAEFLYCIYKKNNYYRFEDSITSFSTAVGNQVVTIWLIALSYVLFDWIADRSPYRQEAGVVSIVILNVAVDFLFYWSHRFSHWNAAAWAAHAPHHSSEEMNYAVGIRTGIFQRLSYIPFLAPLAWCGFSPAIILSTVAVQHVLQLVGHTRVIRNYGPLDVVLNSPSHHRVHHARNPEYIDKNFAGLLIIWDKLFGTFAPEVAPCQYGVLTRLDSWNPVEVNAQYWKVMWGDIRATPRWLDKFKIPFMPTGWRPKGYGPALKSTPTRTVAKTRWAVRAYVLLQVPLAIYVMLKVTAADGDPSVVRKLVLAFFTWAGIAVWGGLLEGKRWAWPLEAVRIPALAITLFYFMEHSGTTP